MGRLHSFLFLLLLTTNFALAVEVDIPNGSIVEGSLRYNGIQPDYLVDFEAPEFLVLREFSKEVGQQNISTWEKINLITKFIDRKMLPRKSYNDEKYRALLKKYRGIGETVPLSAYVKCRAGVCRENAMITHLALKEAGIKNKFVYAKVQQSVFEGRKKVYETIEDHAFSVVNLDGENWIVDSYNPNFHGFSYEQLRVSDLNRRAKLRSQAGIRPNKAVLRKILRVNNFPRVMMGSDSPCQELFEGMNN